jgi:hypothetical protein
LTFFIAGGVAALRAGTSLIQADDAAITRAIAKREASEADNTPAQIEADPLDVFAATPGIARRMPAIVGHEPDFIPLPNPDLPSPTQFQRPADALADPDTLGLRGPVVPTLPNVPLRDDDVYVDMCAIEEAVVTLSGDTFTVSFIWAHDYPLDATIAPGTQGARLRPVVDVAQPSVCAAECMTALRSFLGDAIFEEFTFTHEVELCPFEAVGDVRTRLLRGG